MRRILKNAIQCKHCGDVIESKSRHDYKSCSCGRVSVDGGLDYLRRGNHSKEDFEELSEFGEIIEIHPLSLNGEE